MQEYTEYEKLGSKEAVRKAALINNGGNSKVATKDAFGRETLAERSKKSKIISRRRKEILKAQNQVEEVDFEELDVQ